MYGLRQGALSQVLVERIRAQAADDELRALLDHFVVVSDPRAHPAVAALLTQDGIDDERRLSLCAFLVSQGDDSRMAELETLLAKVGGPGLGRNYRLFEHAPRLSPGVLAVVAKLAESEPAGLALNAVRLLGQFGTAKEMPALERLVESKDTLVSKYALEALQKRTGNVPRESLVRVLAGTDEQRVLAAADALRRADDASGFERVLAIAGGSTPARAEALRVLGRFRRMEGVEVLLGGLDAPDEGVRIPTAALSSRRSATTPEAHHRPARRPSSATAASGNRPDDARPAHPRLPPARSALHDRHQAHGHGTARNSRDRTPLARRGRSGGAHSAGLGW
jgi:hypothetical protein